MIKLVKSRLAALSSATLLGQLFFLAATPFLTRVYSQEDFGTYAALMSCASILSVIGGLRLEVAIPLQDSSQKANSLLFICFLSISAMSILSFVGVYFVSGMYSSVVFAFPGLVFSLAIFQVLTYRAIYSEDIYSIAKAKIFLGAGMAVFSLLFGFLPWGAWGLAAGCIAGYLLAAIMLYMMLRKKVTDITFDLNLIKINRKFPLLSAPSALVNGAGVESLAIILAFLYGAEIAGLLAVGQRAIISPLGIIARSWSSIYYSDISAAIKNDPYRLTSIYIKTSFLLALVAVPVVLSMTMLATKMFEWFFGSGWGAAGELMFLMTPYILVHFIVTPLSQTLNAIQCQGVQLAWDVARLLVVIASLVLPYVLGYGASYAVATYSVAGAVMYIVLYIATLVSLKKYSLRKLS